MYKQIENRTYVYTESHTMCIVVIMACRVQLFTDKLEMRHRLPSPPLFSAAGLRFEGRGDALHCKGVRDGFRGSAEWLNSVSRAVGPRDVDGTKLRLDFGSGSGSGGVDGC
jgi:hypothetical protein